MHTLRRKFVSESLIRSNLWAHSCSILLRSSRKRNFADIMGTRGRVYRNGDVRGGPNISESSSVAFKLVVGSVILFGFCVAFFSFVLVGSVVCLVLLLLLLFGCLLFSAPYQNTVYSVGSLLRFSVTRLSVLPF